MVLLRLHEYHSPIPKRNPKNPNVEEEKSRGWDRSQSEINNFPSEKEDPPERQHLGGGNSNTFLIFTRIPGEMIQFVEHIFQMGWNHQLEHDVHPLPMISVKWVSCSFFVWCFLYPVSLIEDIIPI